MKPISTLLLTGIAAAGLAFASLRSPAASNVTVTGPTNAGGSFNGGNPNVFTPTAADATASTTTVQASLNAGIAVTINTASAAASPGDLTVTGNVGKTAGASSLLTLNAVQDLVINSTLSASSGAMPLALNAGRNISNSQSLTTNNGNVTASPAQTFTVGASINAGTGQMALPTGTLAGNSSQTITAATLTTSAGTSLPYAGTVAGNLIVGGTLSPADTAPESIHANQSLTLQSTATMVIHLGGSSTSQYDRATAGGAITVAGALQVGFSGAFENTIGGDDTFTILSGASRTGTFTGYPDGSRYTLANDLGSLRVNYTATSVTLSDWQPLLTDLIWDPGTAEAGTNLFTNTNTRAGRHYFRVFTQSTDIGAWRTRLTMISGEAALYLRRTNLPVTTSFDYSSAQTGSDGLVLNDDQFDSGEEWYLLVNAAAGAQWRVVSGRAYVHDLGALPFTDSNGSTQYDIGEAVSPQSAPAIPMAPEGIRFYKSTVPAGTPAWSLWLMGSVREVAVRIRDSSPACPP